VAVWGAEFKVLLNVSNGAGVVEQLKFGVHSDATPGIDPQLGELELPPWPPSTLFSVRFLIPQTEGVALDLRQDTQTERTHTMKWQPGGGGYPITVRWDSAALPPGDFRIMDGYGGGIIPPIDMRQVDSLRVPPSQNYVKMLKIVMTPGPPEASPVIASMPSATIFAGQRFGQADLDDYVHDEDTPDTQLEWTVTATGVIVAVVHDRVLELVYPETWTGREVLEFVVTDPQGNSDEAQATFEVRPNGPPAWEVPITVRNAGGEELALALGIDPSASDGIDPALGEIALPPWPPTEVFDVRCDLPDHVTASRRDLRATTSEPLSYHAAWQSGTAGYPMIIQWPNELPEGEFTVQDDVGGLFISPVDMRSQSVLQIPESLETLVTGVQIATTAVIDTVPPSAPRNLRLIGWTPGAAAQLQWDAGSDPHFAYYEVLFDSVDVGTRQPFSWDWSEDSSLSMQGADHTTVELRGVARFYVFEVRAWDSFGNVSLASNPVVASNSVAVPGGSASSPTSAIRVRPNPARASVEIKTFLSTLATGTLTVVDAAGRAVFVRQFQAEGGRERGSCWDLRDAHGRRVPAGVYGIQVTANEQTSRASIVVLPE